MKTTSARSKRIQGLIGSALPMLLIGSLQADTSLAAERPDFSGSWQLNEERSENPRDKVMEKMGGGRGRGGSGGMGGGGMRGGGGPGGRGGGSREDVQARFEARAERIKALEISHQDPELVIGFADGSNRTIYTDGRKVSEDLAVGVFESKTKWKGNSQVVFKSESPKGAEITEIYELDETGDLLFVTTRMEGEGRRPDVSFNRVYDRVTAVVPVEPDPEEATG